MASNRPSKKLIRAVAALRAAGLTVHEFEGWKTRGRPGKFEPIGIVAHHTAAGGTAPAPSAKVVLGGRPDIPPPLCNILMGRDSGVRMIAAARANHAGKGGPWRRIRRDAGGTYTIGIEIEHRGTSAEKWSPKLYADCVTLVAVLVIELGISIDYVFAHKEWAPRRKIDPYGWNMDKFRADVKARVAQLKAAPAKPSTPTGGARPRTVVVRKGQTLAGIAAAVGLTLAALLAGNPQVKDPDRITPGQTITIPPRPTPQRPVPKPSTVKPTKPAKPGSPSKVAQPRPKPVPAKQKPPAAAPTRKPTLRLGSRGPAVSYVQRELGARVDGRYGPKTRAKVIACQAKMRLPRDGVVGPRTWRVIPTC